MRWMLSRECDLQRANRWRDRSRSLDSSWSRRYGEHGARRTLICIIDWIWGARGTRSSRRRSVPDARSANTSQSSRRRNFVFLAAISTAQITTCRPGRSAALNSVESLWLPLSQRKVYARDQKMPTMMMMMMMMIMMTMMQHVCSKTERSPFSNYNTQHRNESYSVKTDTKTDEQ